jgi:hypothetical protein
MQNGAKTASGASAGPKRKACGSARSTNSRNMRSSPFISGCCSFSTYKRMLLQEERNQPWNQGFAIVNALIFGKVVPIAQALNLGRNLKDQALIWVALGKSLLFTVVLILFHIAEEAIRAWSRRRTPSTRRRDRKGARCS